MKGERGKPGGRGTIGVSGNPGPDGNQGPPGPDGPPVSSSAPQSHRIITINIIVCSLGISWISRRIWTSRR